MKKVWIIILFLGWVAVCVFVTQNLFKKQSNETPPVNIKHRAQVGRQGSTAVGRIVSMTRIDTGEKAVTYEFLIQKDNTNTVVSVVQTNKLGLKPGDNVILVTLDGTTRIRAKY